MACIKISESGPLSGNILVQGSKNAALPIISAALLIDGKCVIENCPRLSDIYAVIEIIESLGGECEFNKNTLSMDLRNVKNRPIGEALTGKLRCSVTFAGALYSRFKEAKLALPGGCELGPRPIDMHIDAFKKLGIKASCSGGYIELSGKSESADIVLSFPSVGATENAMLAAVFSPGQTRIINGAKEPEIVCLQNFLNKAGAKISGAGTGVIHITGVEKLNDVTFRIDADRIAAATYMACALSCGGEVSVYGVRKSHMESILSSFEQMGAKIIASEEKIKVISNGRLNPIMVSTMPYPGFPTDALPLFTALAATSKATSVFTENIFQNRFRHLDELSKLGAEVHVFGKTCVIIGKDELSGAKVNASDLRGGASLVVAALASRGTTEISDIHYIDRGYENFCENLSEMGANITRDKRG